MSAKLPNTRFDVVEIKNFRCFAHLQLDFHPRLTVLVAPNGGGKTAILDLLAIALKLFVDTLHTKQSSSGFEHKDVRLGLQADHTMTPMLPVAFSAKGHFAGKSLAWSRQLKSYLPKSKTTIAEAGDLKKVAQDLFDRLVLLYNPDAQNPPVLPLIGYYGTGRLWGPHRLSERRIKQNTRLDIRINGYEDCLTSLSRYKFFVDWFERFSREAQKEKAGNDASPHKPLEKLEAVRTSVDQALNGSGWKSLEWDFTNDTIVAWHKDHGRLPIDSLSDGIRNMIGLVADIAHRAVRLNPHLRTLAARESPGIVLIDEVDMHLHPKWQQVVLPSLLDTFPAVQFIVTTHSPQVLTTLRKENIRVLIQNSDGKWVAEMPTISPLSRESGEALAHIMGTHPRPIIPEILDDLHTFEILVKEGKAESPAALAIKARLDAAGYEFSAAQRTLFTFLAGKAKRGSEG